METPKITQPSQKPANEPAIQVGDVIVPGVTSNAPQPNIRPTEPSGNDQAKGNAAQTTESKNGNTANPPKEVAAAPQVEPAQK